MATRGSIWYAADGTEHKSRQSADVADAANAIRAFVTEANDDIVDGKAFILADTAIEHADELEGLLATLRKARAALAKHEAKGE